MMHPTNKEAHGARGGDSSLAQPASSAEARAQRRAALNLMEDALQSREALEKANSQLREGERRSRELIDALPAAVYTTDAEGRLTHFNQACIELSGRTPQLGTDHWCVTWKLYHPDGTPMPHDECPMAIALKEGHADRGAEAIAERPDGTRVWFAAYPTPLKDAEGRIVGGINMLVEITERVRMERRAQEQAQELSDLHRRKDEFLAMLSHELRNPLAPIANAVQLLRMDAGSHSQTGQHARAIIERQVGQLSHLVDDLLEVSRITTGRIQLRPERVAVAGIAERAVETCRPLIDERRHKLTVSVPAEPIWVHADAARMEQVLVNLLTNAAKYTDPGGQIWLTAEAEGKEAVFRVRDSGVGIPPELLPRIFDLFTQAERSLDRSQGGLGIGLSLVQRLVELHAGSVRAFSALGQGSEFVVRLPITSMAPSPSPRLNVDASSGRSHRVLVVDDNVDSAESLAMLLQASGHDVRTAHDSKAALATALDYRPNVVLLDIGLPGMSGFEVAARLRQERVLDGVTLIALTGYAQEADRTRSQEAGFDHHLVKPVEFESVRRLLATIPAPE